MKTLYSKKAYASVIVITGLILAGCSAEVKAPNVDLPINPNIPNPGTSRTAVNGTWQGKVPTSSSSSCNVEISVDQNASLAAIRSFKADCDDGFNLDLDEQIILDTAPNDNPNVLAYDVLYDGKKVGFLNHDGSQLYFEIEKDGIKVVFNVKTIGDALDIEGTMLKQKNDVVIIRFLEADLTKVAL